MLISVGKSSAIGEMLTINEAASAEPVDDPLLFPEDFSLLVRLQSDNAKPNTIMVERCFISTRFFSRVNKPVRFYPKQLLKSNVFSRESCRNNMRGQIKNRGFKFQ